MKIIYAKFWLDKFIQYRFNDDDFCYKLNRAVINLSHRVYHGKGDHGHVTRQDIRKILVDHAYGEIKRRYGVEFEIKNMGTENTLFVCKDYK